MLGSPTHQEFIEHLPCARHGRSHTYTSPRAHGKAERSPLLLRVFGCCVCVCTCPRLPEKMLVWTSLQPWFRRFLLHAMCPVCRVGKVFQGSGGRRSCRPPGGGCAFWMGSWSGRASLGFPEHLELIWVLLRLRNICRGGAWWRGRKRNKSSD